MDFAWVLADTFHRAASSALDEAAQRLAKPELLELMALSPSVRARPTSRH
jgi:hypothetical protein